MVVRVVGEVEGEVAIRGGRVHKRKVGEDEILIESRHPFCEEGTCREDFGVDLLEHGLSVS